MSGLMQAVLVGSGGFVGSSARYLMGQVLQRWASHLAFPLATLAVNLSGCFAIGFLAAFAETRGAFGTGPRLFLLVGVLGGFTTFSAFALETLVLTREGSLLRPAVNVVAHVGGGLAAAWLGHAAGGRSF